MKIQIELVGFLDRTDLADELKGKRLEIADGATLGQILEILQLSHKSLICVINGKLASRSAVLADEDTVQLVPPIGGG